MTLGEFKAWLDGYSESWDGWPTDEQWQRVKEQIEKVAEPAAQTSAEIDLGVSPVN